MVFEQNYVVRRNLHEQEKNQVTIYDSVYDSIIYSSVGMADRLIS